MATKLVKVETTDGTFANFDVDNVSGIGPERVTRDGETVIARMNEPLDQALASARPAAESIIQAFRGISPDETTVEFGLRIDAQAGAVFAKAGIGAHFTVTLAWKPSKPPPEPTVSTESS